MGKTGTRSDRKHELVCTRGKKVRRLRDQLVRVQEGTRKLQSIKHAQLELEPAKIPPTRSPHTAWALSHLLFQATSLPLFALTSIHSCLDFIPSYRCSHCFDTAMLHQVRNAQAVVINTPLIVLCRHSHIQKSGAYRNDSADVSAPGQTRPGTHDKNRANFLELPNLA
jgi:hypothetical protein